MLRSVVPIGLLLASLTAPAFAMDPSATEETNCLAACDANGENCGAGHALRKNHSSADNFRSSSAISSRRLTGFSAMSAGTLSQPREVKR